MEKDNKVHHAGESSSSPATATKTTRTETSKSSEALLTPTGSSSSSPPQPPMPGTYVIQVPKELIFGRPPPENANKFQYLSGPKPRQSCCRRLCSYYAIVILFLLAAAATISAGVLYHVYRSKAPKYSVLDVAIRGLNLTSSSAPSPEFDVSVRAENRNEKFGIYYLSGSEVEVFNRDVRLSNGALPAFCQPSKNVTVFQTELKGSSVVLSDNVKSSITNEQTKREGAV